MLIFNEKRRRSIATALKTDLPGPSAAWHLQKKKDLMSLVQVLHNPLGQKKRRD